MKRRLSEQYEISEASSISDKVGDLLSHYPDDFWYFWILCK
ncbi:hypothetical protein ES288_D09G165200v1 [Gossypium darwinii]|uniref:Uncharacterized protein n=1 Tax=Gossypium darwinii TaxID=34276 RepID=A0A5D2B9Y2_GOSDA|nr:hypothetical protein ES288_D09G165200v1 [Gossypium darwinii]